jgi:membrane peptidoglycan carboxypeptidase
MSSTENRRRRWYDWVGLAPSRLIRILLILGIFPLIGATILLIYTWRASQFDLDEMSALPESCVAYDVKGKVIGPLTSESRINVSRKDLPDNLEIDVEESFDMVV